MAAAGDDNRTRRPHKEGIKRSGGAGLSQREVTQIFDQKVGTSDRRQPKGDRMIFKIFDAKGPPVDPKAADYSRRSAEVTVRDSAKTSSGNISPAGT